jgi:uncharacterized protein with HEPN domain
MYAYDICSIQPAKQSPLSKVVLAPTWTTEADGRDRLTHAYFEVNLDIIWDITSDLPPLLETLETCLGEN